METQSTTITYKCDFCKRSYKRYSNFKKHAFVCEEINKSKYLRDKEDEIKDEIPSMRDMYVLLQTFIQKNVELEKKVEEMGTYINRIKRHINIIDWLNANATPSVDFDTWIDNFTTDMAMLEYIFNTNIVEGTTNAFIKNLPIEDHANHPIRCFKQKTRTFYRYCDGSWNTMSEHDVNVMLLKVSKKMDAQFTLWKEEHNNKIANDDNYYMNVYMRNVRIYLGGTPKDCISTVSGKDRILMNKKRTKQALFDYLEQDLKNIVEYRFTF